MIQVPISGEYITLGQFLKKEGLLSTGGEFKFFVEQHVIEVNGEVENRRGKKLVPGDTIEIKGRQIYKVVKSV